MAWFRYSQNNSGGEFRGPGMEVYVEAETATAADSRALGVGLYFDGVGDCPCCGYRWYEASGSEDPPAALAPSGMYDSWAEVFGVPRAIKFPLAGPPVAIQVDPSLPEQAW